jgi:hypothetical protein
MADDDRYRWLDDEVAERLLRGASVNARSAQDGGRRGEAHDNVEASPTSTSARPGKTAPSWAVDGRTLSEAGVTEPAGQPERHPADRLASLLGELAAEQTAMPHTSAARHRTGAAHGVHGAPAELPGEAAALAAFRAAHGETVRSGNVEIGAGPTESGTVVGRRVAARERRGRRPGAGRLVSLGGRPLRAGFAMAMAGCALGGVAVAATTGVLPTPFGGGGTPAASVSPLASPSGGDREAALGGGDGSPDEDNGPRRGTREGGKSGPSDSPSGEDLAGKGKGKDGKGPHGPDGKDWPDDGKGLSEAEKKAIARALCAAYDNHELSLRDRLRLEAVAGGPAGVQKFCDKHDGGGWQSGGPGNSGGIGTPGDSGGNGDVGGGGGPGGGGPGGDSGGDSGGDTGGSDGGDSGGGDSGGVGTPSNGGADGSGGGDGDGDSGDSAPGGTDERLGAPSQI